MTISDDIELKNFRKKAVGLLNEMKILQVTRSANILIDIFGLDENFKKLKQKRIGKRIELHFPELNGSMTITNVSRKEDFNATAIVSEDPDARIIFNVDFKDGISIISKIIRTKRSFSGLIKAAFLIVPKLLTKKIKIEGPLILTIASLRCLMIGKNTIYKEKY